MGWDVSKPAGTDAVNTVDNQIRADKQTLLDAIGAEHDFSASTTTGKHDEGSARCWVDTAANRSSRDSSEGRLFIETDTQKLYYGDSASGWQQFAPKRNIVKTSYTPTTQVSWNGTSFAKITANMDRTITTKAGSELLVTCTGTVKTTVSGKNGYLCLAVDGIRVTDADNGQLVIPYNGGIDQTFTIARLVTDGDGPGDGVDLSAGSHTVSLEGKVDSGGACELVQDVNISLNVEEV
jgi:hypothetical protein